MFADQNTNYKWQRVRTPGSTLMLCCRGTSPTVREGSVAIWAGALPNGRANAPRGFVATQLQDTIALQKTLASLKAVWFTIRRVSSHFRKSFRSDSDRRRRLLLTTNQAEPSAAGLLGWSRRRGPHVTISRFHRQVWLMHADSNLTALATFLSCCFRIVANAVLPTQFLSNSRERFGQLRRVVSLIEPTTALVCQGVQILIGSVVISLGCYWKRNASVDWRTIDRLGGRPRT